MQVYKTTVRGRKQMNEIDLDVINALVKTSRMSIAEISKRSGILRTNLMDALAARRGIPLDKQQNLLSALGLENSLPKPDEVHYWQAGFNLSSLQISVNTFFPNGAVVAGLWREGGKVVDFKRAKDKQLFAIYDDRTVVILMRTSLGTHAPLAKLIGPETIIGLRWKGERVGSDTMVALPKETIADLTNCDFEDAATLRHLIKCEPSISWVDVLTYIKQQWMTPKDALDALMVMNQGPLTSPHKK